MLFSVYVLLVFVRRRVCHSANAQRLPGIKVTDIDLVAGGEPAAFQVMSTTNVAAVKPERGRSWAACMISRSVVRELMSTLNVVLSKQICRYFSKNKM